MNRQKRILDKPSVFGVSKHLIIMKGERRATSMLDKKLIDNIPANNIFSREPAFLVLLFLSLISRGRRNKWRACLLRGKASNGFLQHSRRSIVRYIGWNSYKRGGVRKKQRAWAYGSQGVCQHGLRLINKPIFGLLKSKVVLVVRVPAHTRSGLMFLFIWERLVVCLRMSTKHAASNRFTPPPKQIGPEKIGSRGRNENLKVLVQSDSFERVHCSENLNCLPEGHSNVAGHPPTWQSWSLTHNHPPLQQPTNANYSA